MVLYGWQDFEGNCEMCERVPEYSKSQMYSQVRYLGIDEIGRFNKATSRGFKLAGVLPAFSSDLILEPRLSSSTNRFCLSLASATIVKKQETAQHHLGIVEAPNSLKIRTPMTAPE